MSPCARVDALEGQTVEFKASFAQQDDGIQTLVGFANSRGGSLYFGVKDDGTVLGADVGTNTLEQLAASIRDHTYPSLPAYVDERKYGEHRVVSVEVETDVPPVVGAYLYARYAIRGAEMVDASALQAFRRVGRVTQKEDFMRMRARLPSDPRIRLAGVYVDEREGDGIILISGKAWIEEGSGSAHRLTFYGEPPETSCDRYVNDLPYPEVRYAGQMGSAHSVRELVTQVDFTLITSLTRENLPPAVQLHAAYMDDQGLEWDSSRLVELTTEENRLRLRDRGQFRRRIVRLPAKETG
jgi:hypothetical protein